MRKTLKKGFHYFSIITVLIWSTGFALPNNIGIAQAAEEKLLVEESVGPAELVVQPIEEPVQSLLQVEVQVEEQVVEEPVEINTQSNAGGNTCFGDSCGDDPVYVKAYKIVCSDESYLPNWGTNPGGAQITSDTAADFLAGVNNPTSDHQNCWLEEGWQFQWGFDAVSKFNGDYYGPAPTGDGYNEWKNFDTLSDVNGLAMVTIPWDEDMDETNYLWVRESLQEGYLPFAQNNDLQNSYSAEIYCNVDVLNYDNYDRVDSLEPGSTYWCVAINVLLPNEGPQCGNGELEDGEQCDDGNTADGDGCSANCTIEEPSYDPYCGDGIKNQLWEMCDIYDFGDSKIGGQECNQYCQIPNGQCSDLVLAKINSDSILNTGDGNVTDDIYLGAGDYVIPNNAWFPLFWLGSYFSDGDIASYEDVPGMAVQRLNGSLRTVLYGTGDELTDIEHLGGDIMFYNATVNSVSNDPSNAKPGLNNMENGFDGTTGPAAYPLNDEAEIVSSSQVDYWMTVQLADDGFYSHWTIIDDCREDGYDPYCGDGRVNQDWEQCDPGLDKGGEERCNQYCQYPTNECSDLVLARVNTNDIINEGDGNMSSDVYLGASDYTIPSGAWFALFWSGHAADDGHYLDADVAGYEDVEGYAVQRLHNNVRLVMHGTNETAEDIEHSDGSVEFYNATVSSQYNDISNDFPGYNTVEEPFNGSGVGSYNTVNDELWVSDSTHSNFWLTTGRADDGFYTRWSIVNDCREDEPTMGPWCSILLGVYKEAIESGNYNMIADIDNDQDVDAADLALINAWYQNADNDNCYEQFEDPEYGFQYSCEDYSTIGWCQGVWQGLTDYMGTQSGDLNFSSLFDLYEDGKIDVKDLAIFAQYMPVGDGDYDQVGCFNLLVPPLEAPICEEPENPGNPGGTGGSTFPARIENVISDFSCSEHGISWSTSRPALTWITYGADENLGNEIKGDVYTNSHSVSLPDLAAGTTYYYRIHILDTLGLTAHSDLLSFVTPNSATCNPNGENGGVGGNQPTPPQPEVQGVKEIACNWHRPSGSAGVDSDVIGVEHYADGSLIRGCNTPEVYILRNRMKWHIPNWDYLHNHYEGQRIFNIQEEVKNAIPNWTGDVAGAKFYAEGSLLKGPDGAIYLVTSNGIKHIKNLDELKKYAGQPIVSVSEDVLFAYKQL